VTGHAETSATSSSSAQEAKAEPLPEGIPPQDDGPSPEGDPPDPPPPEDDIGDDGPPDDDSGDDPSDDDDSPPGGSGPAGGRGDGFGDDFGDDNGKAKSDKLFDDAPLRRRGYREVAKFEYKLPDGTTLYEKIRYEHPRLPKQFKVTHKVGDLWMEGAGPRHIPFNWTRLLCAPPGANVFAVEGEGKVIALHKVGHLGTCTAFHEWAAESINALTGHHLFIRRP
jgi:hypothetical protein